MKLIVSMIREIFKDAESVRSGLSHVPSQPARPGDGVPKAGP